ncbi:MAG TPA: ACT domain-containing protein [Euryarchaeota archaeon]|nr:ACT domain-containing protein [Euryarchaeota archaeon]
MKPEQKPPSNAELTREYIDSHPSIRDCISKDLINYSSLARQIMREAGLKNEEAILAACRRYALKLSKSDFEGQIISLLNESNLEIKNRICIVIAKNEWTVLKNLEGIVKRILEEKSALQIIQSSNAITVMSEEKHLPAIQKAIGEQNIVRIREGLAEITVKSPSRIEDIPGAFAYICSMLSEHDINLVEAVSCYTDTIFVVEKDVVMRAFEILSKIIEVASEY